MEYYTEDDLYEMYVHILTMANYPDAIKACEMVRNFCIEKIGKTEKGQPEIQEENQGWTTQ